MKYSFAFLLLTLSVAACSPKVVTDMYTQEYAPTSPDSVRLFMLHQPVPPMSKAIGEVKVVDNGLSIKGHFDRVLQMAIDATAQHGGNGLVITEHRAPDFVSSIHRVWGTMLRLPQAAADSLPLTTEKRMNDFIEYDEFQQFKAYQRYLEEMEKKREEVRKNAPRNILRLSAGPSWMLSKYQIGSHLYKSRTGYSILADYEHLWPTGIGFGINYIHIGTSFDEGVKTHINYVGPSVVLGFGSDWRYEMALGVGYSHYAEKWLYETYTEDKVSPMLRFAVGKKIVKGLSLGLQLTMLTMRMDKPDGIELEKNEFYGIQHFGLQAGLRYYF